MIRLRFTSEKNLGSFFVGLWTWDWKHTHVEFYIDADTANFINRNHVPDFRPGAINRFIVPGYLGARPDHDPGVQLRSLGYIKPAHQEFAHVDCDDATALKVLQFAFAQVGDQYDWLAILGDAFHKSITERDCWDCSAFFEAGFIAAGDPLLNDRGRFHWTSPAQIANSPKVIFE